MLAAAQSDHFTLKHFFRGKTYYPHFRKKEAHQGYPAYSGTPRGSLPLCRVQIKPSGSPICVVLDGDGTAPRGISEIHWGIFGALLAFRG